MVSHIACGNEKEVLDEKATLRKGIQQQTIWLKWRQFVLKTDHKAVP
jgi:hypothetical protein